MDSEATAADELALVDEQILESLLQGCRTSEGRSVLASAFPIPLLLRHLSSPLLLLPGLRFLRNLCAGEPVTQDSFIRSGGAESVGSAILGPPLAAPEALRAGLQLLGNAALAGEEHRNVVWARFFPDGFLWFASVRGAPGVRDALCMVLDTCCSAEGGRWRLRELCWDKGGLDIVVEIIKGASLEGHKEEWLEWLLSKICIEESYLPELFAKLGFLGAPDMGRDLELRKITYTCEQSFLLNVLSRCLCERPHEVTVSHDFALEVLNILKEACGLVDFSSRGCSELPTGVPAVDILGYSLLILRDVCAWGDASSKSNELPVNSLLSAGILELVLHLLHELEPLLIVKKSIELSKKQGVLPDTADTGKPCPYRGFRRDLVSIISNCLHGKKIVQDEVRERDGILLLLQQCVLDEDNPFLREWALLAISNLLDKNPENQHEVAELRLQGSVQTPEIANLGLRVEVDEKSGRPKLVNTPQ